MNLSRIAESYNIPENSARLALQMAIENACQRFFRNPHCWIDLEERIATIHFRMPKDRRTYNDLARPLGWPEWKPDPVFSNAQEIIPAYLDFHDFPRRILSMSKSSLMNYVHFNMELDRFEKWRKKIQTVVEGIIREKLSENSFSVEVSGEICLFEKRFWIEKEFPEYYPGNSMFFCVHNLYFNGSVGILLSRRSLNLPANLMKFNDPEHLYRCIRRIPGHKSWVETDALPADSKIIKIREEVSSHLAGEILNIRPFNWGMEKSKPVKERNFFKLA